MSHFFLYIPKTFTIFISYTKARKYVLSCVPNRTMMLMPTASIDSFVLSLRRGRRLFVLLGIFIFLMVMLTMLIDQIFITSQEQDKSLSPIQHRQLKSVNNKRRRKKSGSIEIQNDNTNHTKATIKVYLFDGLKPAHSYSIFKTDTLSRYGSHFEYEIVEQFSHDICHEDAPGSVQDNNMDDNPCLIPPYTSTSIVQLCNSIQYTQIVRSY